MRRLFPFLLLAGLVWAAVPARAAVPLRVCALTEYDVKKDGADYFVYFYGEQEARVIANDKRKEECDVIVRIRQEGTFLSHGKLTADAESAYSGAKLAHVEDNRFLGDHRARAARLIREALEFGTDAYAQVDAERRKAGFAPETPPTAAPAQAAASGPAASTPTPAPAPSSDVDELPRPRAAVAKGHALIIGIERYREHLPKADFAAADAKLIAEYARRLLGYPEEDVALLTDEHATRADLEKYVERWLPNRVERGDDVFVYYSGHGAPNVKTGDSFLVPYDGDPTYIDQTGYPLKRLYKELAKLPAKRVIVMLDSCFSGSGGRSVLAKGARPLVTAVADQVPAKLTVLSASAGDQISNSYAEKGHGLFTYFFLKGLKENADFRKAFDYSKPLVSKTARRQLNADQDPQWREGR